MEMKPSAILFVCTKPALLVRERFFPGVMASRSASATTPMRIDTAQRVRGRIVATQDSRHAKDRNTSYFTTVSFWISLA